MRLFLKPSDEHHPPSPLFRAMAAAAEALDEAAQQRSGPARATAMGLVAERSRAMASPTAVLRPLEQLNRQMPQLVRGMLPKARQKHVKARGAKAIPGLVILDTSEHTDDVRPFFQDAGFDVFEDFQFDHFDGPKYWQPEVGVTPMMGPVPGLPDVLEHIRAPSAWSRMPASVRRGRGATVVVVDTGICPTLPEFPAARRHSLDLDSEFHGQHWHDPKGHGSMCAAIAAGSGAGSGGFDGVAPEATLVSARSNLMAGDILDIYDGLLAAMDQGRLDGPLVVSNSYGHYVCRPPVWSPKHPFMDAIRRVMSRGAVVVFAAGNNHVEVCEAAAGDAQPNSIWGPNSDDHVLSVGTVDRNEVNNDPATPHRDSSRGPGQWAKDFPKPDCVAPTYGQVVWGCGRQSMDWWGTSGACPQVAGLAALIMAATGGRLGPADVAAVIRRTCRKLPFPATMVGHGIIDCDAALRDAVEMAAVVA